MHNYRVMIEIEVEKALYKRQIGRIQELLLDTDKPLIASYVHYCTYYLVVRPGRKHAPNLIDAK